MPHNRVLILGQDNRSTLACIRSLGRLGVDVHLAWCEADAIPAFSRYVRQRYDLPMPAFAPDRWEEALQQHLRLHSYDMVLPMSDREVIPLQLKRDAWCALAPFRLLPQETFLTTYDKTRTHRLVESLGISLPRSRYVNDMESLQEAAKAFSFPLVLKPASSFDLSQASEEKRHVVRVFEPEKLTAIGDRVLQHGTILVQENFIGLGVGVEMLVKEGRVLVAFQHQRLHEAPHGSGSSYRMSVPLHPPLLDAASKLADALRYSGVMMVEFKYQPQTGEWIFIEINARFWGSLPLAVAAGANFPAWLYEMTVHGRTVFPRNFRIPLYARNTWADISWFVKNLRADRTDPRLNTRPLIAVAAELRHVFLGQEVNDTFVRDDMRPAFHEIWLIGQRIIRHLSRFAYSLPLRSPWSRRKRRALLMHHWKNSNSVLFVCKGNICRSPFAERKAKMMFPQKHFSSLGYYPIAGRASPKEAEHVAEGYGVSLKEHRSQCIENKAIQTYDLIIAFDCANLQHLYRYYPEQRSKIFLLGEVVLDSSPWVEDPYGQNVEAFLHCYSRINDYLSTLYQS